MRQDSQVATGSCSLCSAPQSSVVRQQSTRMGGHDSGWWLIAIVVAGVSCVSADGGVASAMTCEVCGSDGEVERAFASERFEPCHTHSRHLPAPQRPCPPGNRACVTRLQAHGGKIVSKSCAERAVSGCHNINHDIYCYCTQPNCNKNANLPIRLRPDSDPTNIAHDHLDDDENDQEEGSADDHAGGGGGGWKSRDTAPPAIVTSVPPKNSAKERPFSSSGGGSCVSANRQQLVSLVVWASALCSRFAFS